MRPTISLIIAAALCVAANARAHAQAPPNAPSVVTTAEAGADAIAFDGTRSSLVRVGPLIGLRVLIADRIEPRAELRWSHATFGRHETADGIAVDSLLATDALVTLTVGARLTLLHRGRVRWTAFGDYERSLADARARVSHARVRVGDLALDQEPFLREHADFSMRWRRFSVGTGVTYRVRPRLLLTFDVALERPTVTTRAAFDDVGRATLEAAGRDPDDVGGGIRRLTASFLPGVTVEGRRGIGGSLRALAIPLPDGWAVGADARLALRRRRN